jgi:tetratricopeptide (TPR) repeat protein
MHRGIGCRALFLGGVVALAMLARPGSPAQAGETSKYLEPFEILKLMDSSKTHYRIEEISALKDLAPDKFADVYWPASSNEVEFPWLEFDDQGGFKLVSFAFDDKAKKILDKAETAYGEKAFDKAAKLYAQAIEASPRCYFAYVGLGDCRFEAKDFEEAARLYQKAIDVDPYDFRGYFFKAHALVKLKRYDEARPLLVQSLALKPHRKSVITTATTFAGSLGVSVVDEPFLPQTLARKEGDEIAVYISKHAGWAAHAMCKAVWLGEPAHRKELIGEEDKKWSLDEEKECLVSLLTGYLNQLEDDPGARDPALEKIKTIVEDGMVNQFVYYEIFSRLSGDAILLLPKEEREKMNAYVAKYVLVPKGGSPAR